MKQISRIFSGDRGHWVGDGFPVRSLLSYQDDALAVSPFLLFDYAGPYVFEPHQGKPRGVGAHPHKGFETVTIVYEGEVSHQDSSGGGGTIRAGDVQWMTAGRGIIHEEFHSNDYCLAGGPFRMVQLWVNLRAQDKMTEPSYQAIGADQIPEVQIADGRLRVIAGDYEGTAGPAATFTPINLWDLRLEKAAETALDLPVGHNVMVALLSGSITIGDTRLQEARIGLLTGEEDKVVIQAEERSDILVMTGEPIGEPVVGYGPFVMNSEAEIEEAIREYNSGGFGKI
ncbi:pirin family protein [Aestuariispira insulae]|uniref:Quercetin 2,3-dioxygenase n=1 Tax=Aestuariispira insulae TaxID=1461337 RepID=A0A3D9H673_9PROT|nr:pirin family protein [Aestuariispira insulae]RED44661.1 hypothetical protein DFP90_11423 [Aestuariispira insulae]